MIRLFHFLLGTLLFGACAAPTEHVVEEQSSLLETVSMALEGEFDNFQQCWQQQTQEELHRVKTDHPHAQLHVAFRRSSIQGNQDLVFEFTIYQGRDSTNVIAREVWRFKEEKGQLYTERYLAGNQKAPFVLDQLQSSNSPLTWWKEDTTFIASDVQKQEVLRLDQDQLHWLEEEGPFANAEKVAFQLLRCRFFSGWMVYPIPEIPDSTYRMGNLRMHDQGGLVQLVLEDGTPTDYSAELTQLVYGKRIAIMKLAVYKEPFEDIDYNSRSISYTWTSPEASRIGINLRSFSSGWTLIEPGYINSNNMDKK